MSAPARKILQEYVITPKFNAAAFDAAKATNPALTKRDFLDDKVETKKALDALRTTVVDVVNRHGGNVLIDGSHYGVAGHSQAYHKGMLVNIPAHAAHEIAVKANANVEPVIKFFTC